MPVESVKGFRVERDHPVGPASEAATQVTPLQVTQEYRATDESGNPVSAHLVRLPAQGRFTDGAVSIDSEVKAHQDLKSHPNVVTYLDSVVSEDGDQMWLFTEPCYAGVDLSEYLGGSGMGLQLAGRVRLVEQVALGLGHLHSANYVHRNLKPQNIIVLQGGGDGDVRVKIWGFTSTRYPAQNNADIYQAFYMAPELFEEYSAGGVAITSAADIFSLGMLLYSVCAGARGEGGGLQPYTVNNEPLGMALHSGQLSSVTLPTAGEGESEPEQQARTLASAMLQTKPEDRPSVQNVLNDLHKIVDALEAQQKKQQATEEPSKTGAATEESDSASPGSDEQTPGEETGPSGSNKNNPTDSQSTKQTSSMDNFGTESTGLTLTTHVDSESPQREGSELSIPYYGSQDGTSNQSKQVSNQHNGPKSGSKTEAAGPTPAVSALPSPGPARPRPRLLLVGGLTAIVGEHHKITSSTCWQQAAGETTPKDDPAVPPWDPITSLPPLEGRCLSSRAACATSQGLFLAGGWDGDRVTGACHLYSVSSGQWERLPDLPTPRHSATAVTVGDAVIVLGGASGHPGAGGVLLGLAEAFRLTTSTLLALAPMPQPMVGPIAAALGNDVYVIFNNSPINKPPPTSTTSTPGAQQLSSLGTQLQHQSTVAVNPGSSHHVSYNPQLPTGGATQLPQQAGSPGGSSPFPPAQAGALLQIYQSADNTWCPGPPLPARFGDTWGATAVAVSGYHVLVAGGRTGLCARYTPATAVWTALTPCFNPRLYPALAVVPTERGGSRVLLAGGQCPADSGGGGEGQWQPSDHVEEYVLGSNRWAESRERLPQAMWLHQLMVLEDKEVEQQRPGKKAPGASASRICALM